MERDLARSDARLTALFQAFTQLVRAERMPRTERLRQGPPRVFSRARRRAEPRRMEPRRAELRRAERRRAESRRTEPGRTEPDQAGPRRPGERWRAAMRSIFYGSLALAATCGSLRYPLGVGYPGQTANQRYGQAADPRY